MGRVPRAVEAGGEGEQGQGQNSRWAELHACPEGQWNLGWVLSPIHENPLSTEQPAKYAG